MSRCIGRWRRRRAGRRWSGSRVRRLFRNMKNIMRRSWRMAGKLVAVAVLSAALYAQEVKPAIDPKPVIDNDRVTVWDVIWTKGATFPAAPDRDLVTMRLTGANAGTAGFSAKG